MACFSAALAPPQAAISPSVRAQPRQICVTGWIVQILVQGLGGSAITCLQGPFHWQGGSSARPRVLPASKGWARQLSLRAHGHPLNKGQGSPIHRYRLRRGCNRPPSATIFAHPVSTARPAGKSLLYRRSAPKGTAARLAADFRCNPGAGVRFRLNGRNPPRMNGFCPARFPFHARVA